MALAGGDSTGNVCPPALTTSRGRVTLRIPSMRVWFGKFQGSERCCPSSWRLLCALVLSGGLSHADPYVVRDGFREASVGRHLELAHDASGAATREAMDRAAFAPSRDDVPNFGYRHGAEWARLRIEDARAKRDELVLEYAYAVTDEVDVYVRESSGAEAHLRAGRLVPHALWPERARLPTFRLPPGAQEVFVRVAGEASHQLPLKLSSVEAWHARTSREGMILAAYYGALTAMLVYNALVWVAAGLRLYGYYVGFLGAYGVLTLVVNGALFASVLGVLPWLNAHLVVPLMAAFGASALRFMLGLLELGALRPRIVRAVRACEAVFAAVALASLVTPYSLALRGVLAIGVVAAALLVSSAVVAARQGERSARWYLLAWSAFLFGSIVNVLRVVGAVPSNDFTANAQQVGSTIEFLLLSFALADRIKQLQATATANAELAATNARLAQEASDRALEEERRLGEEREQFVANTSHELRTPLNGMIGLVQAVLHREGAALSEASTRSLGGVVRSGQRLASLVSDLLDFSSANRGALALYPVATSVRRQAELVVDLLAPSLVGKDVELCVQMPADLPAVHADPNRVQQILFNLLGNAIKFTEKGSIRVGAQVAEGRVVVRVKDTGSGIAEAAQQRIFEAFQQADGGIARRFGGTGLGLAITKQLVEAQGGAIGVTSSPGFGSTFWFSLPVSAERADDDARLSTVVADRAQMLDDQLVAGGGRATLEAPVSSEPSGPRSAVEVSSLAVLVADDEPVNRQVLSELLTLAGHHVRFATNGREAVDAVSARKPDLVLLDVMMPGMSGYEALSAMRAMHDELELPVLMLSAKAQERDLVEGFRRGATDYVIKPFAAAEVLARVNHQARLREALARAAALHTEGAALRVTLAEAEEQLVHAERLAGLGAATAGVAHDLGNPLHHVTTTFGWIRARARDLLARKELTGPSRQDAAAIAELADLGETSSAAALELAEAIRKASRTDGGAEGPVHLDDVVDDALVILGHKAKAVDVEHRRCADAVVRGRRSEFLQVAMNLVGNALDAVARAPGGRALVSLAVDGERVVLRVEDSGPGVPPHLRAKVLEPFFTTKPSGKGTGLGLSTVVTIARRCGGALEVASSDPLGGAAFTFTVGRVS
jgi:signal transduction histidine kinase